MKALTTIALLAVGVLLGGCPGNDYATSPSSLPSVPADIQDCFRTAYGVAVPARTLTVAEIESLWKSDRVKLAVTRKCGVRFLAWYGDLQRGWK